MFKKVLQRLKDKKKWKLYLLYNGTLIKKVKVKEDYDIANTPIFIRVIGHKELFNNFIVERMVIPTRLLKNDENKKISYWGVIDEKGVEVK